MSKVFLSLVLSTHRLFAVRTYDTRASEHTIRSLAIVHELLTLHLNFFREINYHEISNLDKSKRS